MRSTLRNARESAASFTSASCKGPKVNGALQGSEVSCLDASEPPIARPAQPVLLLRRCESAHAREWSVAPPHIASRAVQNWRVSVLGRAAADRPPCGRPIGGLRIGPPSSHQRTGSIFRSWKTSAKIVSIQRSFSSILENIKTSRKPIVGVNQIVLAYNQVVHLNCATLVAWNVRRKIGNSLGSRGS